jgi:serine/threonine protein kinase
LLTARPLFPGKHEIDQIARIHNIVGTPSREVLQQFRTNPNSQISFSFPIKKAQDLKRLLLEVGDGIIELLKKLLEYDPRVRISAADALKLNAFEQLRRIDEEWQESAQILPFPVFLATDGGKIQKSGEGRAAVVEQQKPLPPLKSGEEGIGGSLLQKSRAKAAQRILEYKKKRHFSERSTLFLRDRGFFWQIMTFSDTAHFF